MIFASVGTFIYGFDELISALDGACKNGQYTAFAQIGNSAVTPRHMEYVRFMSAAEMQHRLSEARLVVCHGGLGILGDAMRAGKPIIAVPRLNARNSTDAPANDQVSTVQRLRSLFGIDICIDLTELPSQIDHALQQPNTPRNYDLHCNIPTLISQYLHTT